MSLATCEFESKRKRKALTSPRPTRTLRCVIVCAALLASALCGGCFTIKALPFPESLNSPRPDERMQATKTAVNYPYKSAADRRAALDLLVGRLDDEDDAVRMFAILALEKMTGTRLGYEYHAPFHERARAVASWRRYLIQQAGAECADECRPHVPSPCPPVQNDPVGGLQP